MKKLKDPIYGYIHIEDVLFDLIIDTPEFQRLRGITQTSYSPLYASAVHNRFVHSLGVYYLGNILSNSIIEKSKDSEKEILEKYSPIFKYACLLHDVGHAPFSHTGEEFFLEPNGSREKLHKEIVELTGDEYLDKEIKQKNYNAAPHELMSVIVSLQVFRDLFNSIEGRSFFARCILGYKYTEEMNEEKSFLNCLIQMLNSPIIDVDKLDYLIRDAFITGYDTVSIDYVRLLKSVMFIKKKGLYEVVFSQSSISVIEDVIYAHDSERKWIQNHPIVQYDSFLLHNAIELLKENYNEIFTYKALSQDGVTISDNLKLSLICDGDIVFLMKNKLERQLVKEYFDRRERRHPLWKSEAEYKAIFNSVFADKTFDVLETMIENLVKYLSSTTSSIEMNQRAFDELEKDISATEAECKKSSDETRKKFKENLENKQKYLELLKCFKNFAEKQRIDFDFVVLTAKRFNSGFGKIDFEEVEVEFPTLGYSQKFKSVANSLNASKSDREKFFYVFYKRKSREATVDSTCLAIFLNKFAAQYAFQIDD